MQDGGSVIIELYFSRYIFGIQIEYRVAGFFSQIRNFAIQAEMW